MNQETKKSLLSKAIKHVAHVRTRVHDAVQRLTALINAKVSAGKIEDGWTNAQVKAINKETLRRTIEVGVSPYFCKCVVKFDDISEQKELYFGKFSFAEESIYSWITPAGSIRFDSPGNVTYTLPNGKLRTGTMLSKDQYLIDESGIKFYSTESLNEPRELIHQEHFSQHKKGFVLPEIVSQMERAQDTVIRAHYKGPFVISGPAGSGKTTLALHRIAYLMQSPQTTELFPSEAMLILVQDESAKAYFSTLLPSLGITSVSITTFTEWAAKIVGVEGYTYQSQYVESDEYEYHKIKALRSHNMLPKYSKTTFKYLESIYGMYLSEQDKAHFEQQKKEKALDRIDLTVLLTSFLQTYNKLSVSRTYQRIDSGGDFRTRTTEIKLEYALIAIDEFQNYLPEQITLFKRCIDQNTQSLMYIGDMKQRVRMGTIKHWDEVAEFIHDKREVLLDKVYRNTRQIVEYIQQQGFDVEVPTGIKSGKPVTELKGTTSAITKYINECIDGLDDQKTIGVIVNSVDEVKYISDEIKPHAGLHIVTSRQSQGLEFDVVCLVQNAVKELLVNTNALDADYVDEKNKIDRDLYYVSLTRAMEELHVLTIEASQ
ncbi:MAG: hypothetical protein RLY57_361 [Candidatus Parcubacteria bacterium]